MNRSIADWLWRLALLLALVWIGSELHEIRVEMQTAPDDDQTVTMTDPDPAPEATDDLRARLDLLNEKLDAVMIAMTKLQR